MKQNNHILLVDGMALLFRGFYATAFSGHFMRTSKGVATNGVYQFIRYFLNAIDTFHSSHVICCWDMGGRTFRTEMYPDYKANRSAPPDDLIPQFDLVKEVVDAFNVPNIGMENYEADDCIGTLATLYSGDNDVTILTGDHDLLQLVNEGTQVAIMKKGIGYYNVFDNDNFHEKRGLDPQQIIDMKALTGDSADNYPGVKGIGEKTALKLLQQHKTLDVLLQNTETLTSAMKKKIDDHLDILHLSRDLAAIQCDVPLVCSLEDALWDVDYDKVNAAFERLEFSGIDKLMRH